MNRRHTSIQSLILSLAVTLTLGAAPVAAQSLVSQVVAGPAAIVAAQEAPAASSLATPAANGVQVSPAPTARPAPATDSAQPQASRPCASLADVVSFFRKAGQEATEGAHTTSIPFPAGAVQMVQF